MSYASLSAIRQIWKYQPANDNNAAVIQEEEGEPFLRTLAWRERRRLIATKKKEKARKNAIEQTFF